MDVHYLHFETLNSTNTWAKENAHKLDSKALTCITADTQTGGRGRMGRSWVSQKGNLHMSLFLPLPLSDPRLPNFAQLLAYAAAQVILSYEIPVQIKWPNDLLVEGKKLSGVLVETCKEGVVLGIGINVNAKIKTDQPTTYMAAYTKSEIDIKNIRQKLVAYFLKALTMSFHDLVPYFNQLLAFKNEKVRCHCDGKKIEGILIGINEKGQLQLQGENGIVSLSSGDIRHLETIA